MDNSDSIQITIRCFAQLREFFATQTKLKLTSDASISTACEKLVQTLSDERRNQARDLIATCKASVGDDFVAMDFILQEGLELCLLPPPAVAKSQPTKVNLLDPPSQKKVSPFFLLSLFCV